MFIFTQVIITKSERLLHQIYAGSLGVKSYLGKTRETVDWPRLTTDIKDHVKRCSQCQATDQKPAREPLHFKEVHSLPWERIAKDLFTFVATGVTSTLKELKTFILEGVTKKRFKRRITREK